MPAALHALPRRSRIMAVISCLALDFVQEPGEGDAKQARTSTAKRRDASPGTKSLVLTVVFSTTQSLVLISDGATAIGGLPVPPGVKDKGKCTLISFSNVRSFNNDRP